MEEEQGPIRGRGTSSNPANRFELIHYEREETVSPEESPSSATHFYRDHARSILTHNDSPDVGFEVSINPYRGCEHGCVYCMAGDTLILMADGTTRPLEQLRVGDLIYGTVRQGWYLRYVLTKVLAHWKVIKPAYQVRLRDGTCLIAGRDHRFLTERGWKFVTGKMSGQGQRPYLTPNNKLMGIGAFAIPPLADDDYKIGYLCGMVRGDAHLGSYHYLRPRGTNGDIHTFRLALVDQSAIERTASYLLDFEIPTREFTFQEAYANRKRILGIRTGARRHVEHIRDLIAWPCSPTLNWRKGFLAGIFDAEGGYGDGVLRISNTDPILIDTITRCLAEFDFSFAIESAEKNRRRPMKTIRVCGGLREHLRFFHLVHPVIARKCDIVGQAVKSSADLRVESIEPLGRSMLLYDITTGTGDFIANGVVSHNCFARPTHEYLGFSAGLDFETKILVKEDAPALLRKELAAAKWQPKVVALSGVTDPYQPIERRLQLTRRCLEVFVEFRNPVGVVTKNHLVCRDIDLLSELAQLQAAAAFLSITTLDAELARRMEPRATQPAARLAAIQELTQAGVPVGVLVAPVIPGLNDHEIPAILDAAAKAGARGAGYVLLRLPYGLGPLFEQWLRQHYPERSEKVLSRLRDMRGGEIYDPRFGTRMRGEGVLAEQIASLFVLSCRRVGIGNRFPKLSTAAFLFCPSRNRNLPS